MSYITKHILGGDERLVYMTRLHWVYLVQGLVWMAIFWALALLGVWLMIVYTPETLVANRLVFGDNDYGPASFWMFGLLAISGVMLFLIYLFKVMSTEIALSNTRLIFKHGLLFVEVEELEISEIQSESIHTGLLGSLLGYGTVKLDCRFVEDLQLPTLRNPYKFVRAINKLRAALRPAPAVAAIAA
jgi:hypothetical protein